MTINPTIFKAYDIRGIYPNDLNEEIAYRIGRAFVVWMESNSNNNQAPLTFVVGRDGRSSGPALSEHLQRGMRDQGADLIDVGVVSSDQFYFACGLFDVPGVTVTASHNPKEYNGMKFVKKLPFFLSGQEGIQDIRTLVEENDFPASNRMGFVRHEDIREQFVRKLLAIVDAASISPLIVIADTANGVAGPALSDVAGRLSIRLTHLFPEVDGTFPNHPADPSRPENLRALQETIRQNGANVGFALDGDGDRCFVLDETGEPIPNDFLGALIAKDMLQKNPGSAFLYDVRSSWAFPRTVEAFGGRAIMNRVGHAYIKPRMMKERALYGVEVSGHHYFKDFFYCDSGMLPMLLVLQIICRNDQPLSELIRPLRDHYFISGEMNYTVANASAVLERLKSHFQDAPKQYEIDGISVEYKDWHFNLRSSNTEPLLRLNLESIVSKEHMEEKLKELETLIRE